MRPLLRSLVLVTAAAACGGKDDAPKIDKKAPAAAGSGSALPPAHAKSRIEQVPPPAELKQPPADAVTTKDGLVYKKLVEVKDGASPGRNDTVAIHMTGWSQATGATFNTTSGGKPQLMPLANASPGFVEALMLMKKGESALVWIPPALGYVRAPTTGTPETLVYKIELVDIAAAPAVPPDVAAPPKTALALPSGMKYVVVKPATGKGDKIRTFDSVSFDFTGWDKDGRMVQSTETGRRQQTSPVYKLPPAFLEAVSVMGVGERVRLWTTVGRLGANAKSLGVPETPLCFELVLEDVKKGVEPPPPPPDVAAPPKDAKVTAKHVAYEVLVAAPAGAKHPGPTDRVKLHYTGWRAEDGKMFDSSVQRDEPATVAVNAPPVAGWTEVLPLMAVGDKWRVWVPAELAYRGAPGRPQGMLVFELQLLDTTEGPPPAPPRPLPPRPPGKP